MSRLFPLFAILLCAAAAETAGLRGADLGLDNRKLDFNVRRVPAARLFEAIAEIEKREIRVDDCVNSKLIDLKISNVPVPLLMDVLATQVGFEYQLEGKAIRVHCAANAPPPSRPTPPPNPQRVRAILRDALHEAYPKADGEEIERVVEQIEARLGHD